MYPEFIAIYVMLAIAIVLLVVILIIGLKLLSGNKGSGVSVQSSVNPYGQQYQQHYQPQGGNVVFCRHCATQFETSQSFCPRCGTPR